MWWGIPWAEATYPYWGCVPTTNWPGRGRLLVDQRRAMGAAAVGAGAEATTAVVLSFGVG